MRNALAVLYTALMLGANPAHADISAFVTGDMAKMVLSDPAPLPDAALIDMADAGDYEVITADGVHYPPTGVRYTGRNTGD
jgi:hypothetical protein